MDQKNIIRENSKAFRQKKCHHHRVSHVQKICTHSGCIESMASSLLCNQCFRKHPKNHNGMIQYFLEFDKIFSDHVFTDIELLENQCLNVFQEKKQKFDAEIDKQCDFILEEVKQLLESIKFNKKQKYGTNDLADTVLKLKESLRTEYNTLFLIDEANITDQDIKKYLEFYLNFEKKFDQSQAKNEKIDQSIEKELNSISQLFDQKLKDIKSLLEFDNIK